MAVTFVVGETLVPPKDDRPRSQTLVIGEVATAPTTNTYALAFNNKDILFKIILKPSKVGASGFDILIYDSLYPSPLYSRYVSRNSLSPMRVSSSSSESAPPNILPRLSSCARCHGASCQMTSLWRWKIPAEKHRGKIGNSWDDTCSRRGPRDKASPSTHAHRDRAKPVRTCIIMSPMSIQRWTNITWRHHLVVFVSAFAAAAVDSSVGSLCLSHWDIR
jgi:hypothetical protein